MQITDIPIDAVVIDEHLDFRSTGQDIEELAASIERFGLMQPITVATNGDGGYHVIAGRRRVRAVRELGRETIEAIIRTDMSETKAQVVGQIIENLHREDISVMDQARAFAQLGEYDMKQADIAEMVACSPSHVSARLALLKLPPSLVRRVEKGTLSNDLATKIARCPKVVRDQIAESHTVTEHTVSQAIADYDHYKARKRFADEVTKKVKVPVLVATDSWGYQPLSAILADAGDDLEVPEGQEMGGTRITQAVYNEDPRHLTDLVKEVDAVAVHISGSTGHMTLNVLYTFDPTKEREARQAELAEQAAEREAKAAAIEETSLKALSPWLQSPPRSDIMALVLMDTIHDVVTGWLIGDSVVERACARLDLTVEDGEDPREVLLSYGMENTANACRVWLATKPTPVDKDLVRLGLLEHVDYDEMYESRRNHLLMAKNVEIDDLPESWQVDLPEVLLEQEESEDSLEDQIAEALAAAEEDTETGELSEAEVDAITATVTAAFEARNDE